MNRVLTLETLKVKCPCMGRCFNVPPIQQVPFILLYRAKTVSPFCPADDAKAEATDPGSNLA